MDRETLLNMDPNILVSLINLKLRDFYPSLESFCEDIAANQDELENKLKKAGFFYESNINQFK